jgi:hypothetical protein
MFQSAATTASSVTMEKIFHCVSPSLSDSQLNVIIDLLTTERRRRVYQSELWDDSDAPTTR